ncbi:MAG: glycosyl hydrolase 108 family protein [Methylomonas sp.]|jgi:lysozyme family protein
MANFERFFPTLLRFEGGFVNDPDDPGGASNKGVTWRTFQKYAAPLLGVQPTLENLEKLSADQAALIYKLAYWDAVKGDDIDDQNLADIVFDFYVNAGNHAGILFQRILNSMGERLAEDGQIGAETLAALNKYDQAAVYKTYKQGRIAYYRNLAELHPLLQKYLTGWLRRVNSFP